MRSVCCVFTLLLTLAVQGQFWERHNLVFNNARYDIFSIVVDSAVSHSFAILENKTNLTEQAFFDSLSIRKPLGFFAITASIVDSLCAPLGLYISEARLRKNINSLQGQGNFYLKPNGYLAEDTLGGFVIDNSMSFSNAAKYVYALQSGPMLINDGVINSVFDPRSKNRNLRCGVGLGEDKGKPILVFVIAQDPVSFFQMAQIFKDRYNCENALNLESGGNCSMHLPTIKLVYSQNKMVCRYFLINP